MNSFFTNDCLIKEDVKYLIDTKNICSHTEVSEENYNLNAAKYFVNMSIIANPRLFNISLHKKVLFGNFNNFNINLINLVLGMSKKYLFGCGSENLQRIF
jgi:hypothetical protein